MKRQIVFRGKRTDTGEWVEGFLVISHASFNPNQHCIIEGKNHFQLGYTSSGNVCFSESNTRVHKVHPESVGQFTGLTDRNGKKIFEGDILFYQYEDIPYEFVKWDVGDGCWTTSENGLSGLDLTDNAEIIGNITDNPELLNPKP